MYINSRATFLKALQIKNVKNLKQRYTKVCDVVSGYEKRL